MDILLPVDDILSNIAMGLSGAAVASSMIWAVRRLKDWRAEKRYSLSGSYKSFYEDMVDGEKVIQRDLINLSQRGLHFTAQADAQTQTGRGWSLQGEIDNVTGYIYGYYKANSITDAGVGVFVFEQKEPGKLEGIWAGYDSRNKAIQHGQYRFEKYLPTAVRRAKPKDTGRILQIACKELGEGYFNDEEIEHHIKNDILHVAEYDGQIIGFCLSQVLEKDGFQTYLKGQSYRIPPYIKQADKTGKLGFLRSVATDSDFQQKGAGSRLVERALTSLKKSGAEQIFSIAWKTDTVHIAPIFDKNGFTQRASFKKFWHKESIEKGYDCPQCGHPCTCEALLYTKAA